MAHVVTAIEPNRLAVTLKPRNVGMLLLFAVAGVFLFLTDNPGTILSLGGLAFLHRRTLVVERGRSYTIRDTFAGITVRTREHPLGRAKRIRVSKKFPLPIRFSISSGGSSAGGPPPRNAPQYTVWLENEDGTRHKLWKSSDKAAVADFVRTCRPYFLGKRKAE